MALGLISFLLLVCVSLYFYLVKTKNDSLYNDLHNQVILLKKENQNLTQLVKDAEEKTLAIESEKLSLLSKESKNKSDIEFDFYKSIVFSLCIKYPDVLENLITVKLVNTPKVTYFDYLPNISSTPTPAQAPHIVHLIKISLAEHPISSDLVVYISEANDNYTMRIDPRLLLLDYPLSKVSDHLSKLIYKKLLAMKHSLNF